MKKTLSIFTAFALLAAASAMVYADDSATASNPVTGTNAVVRPYPLNYCLNSGEKLGEMGKPVVLDYQGQEFKFCCSDCAKAFKKNPDAFVKKLAAAEKKAAAKN